MSDERARATTPPRLALIVTATLLGGMVAAVGIVGSNAVEAPLTLAAQDALHDAGVTGVVLRFDGREAFLTSSGATPAELADAQRIVEAVDGVRWATVEGEDSRAPQPTLAAREDRDGAVIVNGVVGTAAQASAIQDAATQAFGPDTVVDLVVTDGVAVAPWAEAVPELFGALAQVDQISFLFAPDGAHLAGSAADPAAVTAAAQAALDPVPLTSALTQSGPTAEEAATINGTVIRFVADSVTLDAPARRTVLDLADALRRFPTIGVTLTGHVAIPVGTEQDAVAFSRRRAQAVADALVAAGIDASRIGILGAGSSQPVGDNATEAGAAANRRVTVLIMEAS